MKKLNLNAIRIDGGTQARVQIDNDAVGDYAEAVKAGIGFPPIVVFHDGADHWLADGFHRYHAHKQAGKAGIVADIRSGTVRDAILFSLGANCTHGLRRTNADKRKAVTAMLGDSEWCAWSDRKIADLCGVSQPFVSGLRKPKEVITVITPPPADGVETVTTSGASAKPAAPPKPATKTPPPPTAAPAEPPESFGPSEAEIAAAQLAQEEELQSLRRVADADDKLRAALDEAKRFREENRILKERINSLMNEKAAAVKAANKWKKKAEAYERAAA